MNTPTQPQLPTAIYTVIFADGSWIKAELSADERDALSQAKHHFNDPSSTDHHVERVEKCSPNDPAAKKHAALAAPTQPQIDPELMLICSGVEKCNHYLDLYGTFCALAKEFTVSQVALTGTRIDVSDFFSRSDFRSWDALVNEDGAGEAEAAARALDCMFGADLMRLGALGGRA